MASTRIHNNQSSYSTKV